MTGRRESAVGPVIRRVIVAVDLGAASGQAVAIAGTIAARAGGELVVLHAETFDAPAYFTPGQIGQLVAERALLHERARQTVAAFARAVTDTPFEVVIDSRAPTDAVLAHAPHADVVVMGTHGRTGPRRWWLGSVADRVRAAIATPLLVVPEGPGGRPGELSVVGPPRAAVSPPGESPVTPVAAEIGRLLGLGLRVGADTEERALPQPTLFVPADH